MRLHGRSALLGAVLFSPMKALRVAQKLGKVLLWWLLGVVVLIRLAVQWWQDQPWWTQTLLIFAAVVAVGVWLMLTTFHRPQGSGRIREWANRRENHWKWDRLTPLGRAAVARGEIDLDGEPVRRKPMPQWLRQQIADRDDWTCGICLLPIAKVDDLHIDHIHPVHAGGTDDPDNLQSSHADCNMRKGGMVGWQPPYQRQAPEGWT